MTEQELCLNALCDLLMKEGLTGFQDWQNVARTGLLTRLAQEVGRKDARACALGWFETLDKKNLQGEHAVCLDYDWANAIAGERYGTEWSWDQPTLAQEIYHLRRAVSHPDFPALNPVFRCMCLNNLGNRLRVAGRAIEALNCWGRALGIKPNFGMSLCNRAMVLVNYASAVEDDERVPFVWAAHKDAEAALAPSAIYTSARDELTRKRTLEIKQWIESIADVKKIEADLNAYEGQEAAQTQEERTYRRWCLTNRLYLNPANDVVEHSIASFDSMSLPMRIVPFDSPHMFESFFDQMKQEFVSARWLLYEGITSKQLHFSDREVFLHATEPLPCLSLAVEKMKAAYRISYSLFDKVSFFTNAYMELGIPEKAVTFRTLWRPDEKEAIRKEFDLTTNWGFCALYWLAKDFFEKANDDVAEPQARNLCDVRNFLEHKYLRVTSAKSPQVPPQDLALMLSRQQFADKTVHLLQMARSALIYLAVGVRFEEERRKPGLAGSTIEDLPPMSWMTDEEKL